MKKQSGCVLLNVAGLAIFIACLGLIGLVTFMPNKRKREIGIRKTYGASGPVVVKLLIREVVFLILISSLIAYPVAYFGTRYWMDGFADKAVINPLVYVLATGMVLIIGFLSISYQTVRTALQNPADALRIE